MKIYQFVIFCAIILMNIYSCKKDDKNNEQTTLTFTELLAEKDTISPGQTTIITAIANGEGLSYLWSANAGDILGSGYKVTYVSTPCVLGNIDISCTVRDKGNQTLTKKITIVVI
jgi:hypothetical protein